MANQLNSSEYPDASTPEIPGYTIKSIVGHGGFATVYLAQQHNLKRDVALKVMSPLLTCDPDICARFLREACDTASVSNHPNIVTVHDVGQIDSVHYISMQLLQGPSLKQLIDSGSVLPDPKELIYQLADALEYIHQKGFVHRDIKPANVLFTDARQAILSDFGVARLTTRSTQLTYSGSIIGTAKYMSPEQCQGNSAIDARSDLYSLGIVLYEVLTGHAPYEATSPMAVMLKHINDPVPRLPAEQKTYQPLVDKLMAKQASQRFQSAAILMQAVEKFSEREQLRSASKTHHNTQDDKNSDNHEIRTSTVMAVAVATITVLVGVLVFLDKHPRTSPSDVDVICHTLTQAEIQQRDNLLELASMHEAIGRLTHPPGANAFEAYSLALDMDPCNQVIQQAIETIRADNASL